MTEERTRTKQQMDSPLVSLITPVYNALPYLRDYLASVAAQTWRPIQFIAVDDGSTDGSYEFLLCEKARLESQGVDVQILRIPHAGQAAAINAALPLVEGEFFAWCDADDVMMPENLEEKARCLQEHPECGMARCDGFLISNEKKECVAKIEDSFAQNVFDALFHQTTYCFAGAYMIRTHLFFECYPERRIPLSPEGQNLQLLLPPASRTDCGFVPAQLFRYYQRPDGHSSQKRSYTQQLRRAENFAKLRAEILSYCRCDREHYLRENENILKQDRQRLLQAAALRAREEMKR